MRAERWGEGAPPRRPHMALGSGRSYLSYTRIMVQRARAERRRQGARGVRGPRALAEELGSLSLCLFFRVHGFRRVILPPEGGEGGSELSGRSRPGACGGARADGRERGEGGGEESSS